MGKTSYVPQNLKHALLLVFINFKFSFVSIKVNHFPSCYL